MTRKIELDEDFRQLCRDMAPAIEAYKANPHVPKTELEQTFDDLINTPRALIISEKSSHSYGEQPTYRAYPMKDSGEVGSEPPSDFLVTRMLYLDLIKPTAIFDDFVKFKANCVEVQRGVTVPTGETITVAYFLNLPKSRHILMLGSADGSMKISCSSPEEDLSERDSLNLLKLKRDCDTARTGRNDLCPCGSGKKYKKCCLNHAERGFTPQEIFMFAVDTKGILDLCDWAEKEGKLDAVELQGIKVPPKEFREAHKNRVFPEAPPEFIEWIPPIMKDIYTGNLKKDLPELYFICCGLVGNRAQT